MKSAAIDHRKSHLILLAIVCLSVTALLFTVLVYPKGQRLKTQNKKMAELKMALKEQRTLRPFYDDLLKKVNCTTPETLSCPSQETLSAKNISRIASICEKIAKQNDLKLTRLVPVVDDSQTMHVDVVFQGSFLKFRSLLLALGRLPYLKNIEHFSVQSIENGREIQLKLDIARS